jgi:hypothetical protein
MRLLIDDRYQPERRTPQTESMVFSLPPNFGDGQETIPTITHRQGGGQRDVQNCCSPQRSGQHSLRSRSIHPTQKYGSGSSVTQMLRRDAPVA